MNVTCLSVRTQLEMYNPWKDGCLAFDDDVLLVTKYYRETPESRPVEKCKIELAFQRIDSVKNDTDRLLLLVQTNHDNIIFQFQCLVSERVCDFFRIFRATWTTAWHNYV